VQGQVHVEDAMILRPRVAAPLHRSPSSVQDRGKLHSTESVRGDRVKTSGIDAVWPLTRFGCGVDSSALMIWIAVVAVLVCLVIPVLSRARRAADDGEDYGTVSVNWIVEHRAPDD
jgi:hypothetical protein